MGSVNMPRPFSCKLFRKRDILVQIIPKAGAPVATDDGIVYNHTVIDRHQYRLKDGGGLTMRYTGRHTQAISFPVGGIGTGSIGISATSSKRGSSYGRTTAWTLSFLLE